MAEQTEGIEKGAEASQPASVYDFVAAMVDSMSAIAWQKLGLQPDIYTGRIEKDLVEAKVAIDITTHLATFVEPRLDDEDRRKIHSLIRDLRINYVEKSNDS